MIYTNIKFQQKSNNNSMSKNITNKLKLILVALTTSTLSWFIIDVFIVEISLSDYIFIEFIFTVMYQLIKFEKARINR